MSDSNASIPPEPATPGSTEKLGIAGGPPMRQEIRVVSHSGLMYWWPIWVFGFLFAIWTYVDGYRLAIVPSSAELKWEEPANTSVITMVGKYSRLEQETKEKEGKGIYEFKTRVTARAWMGPIYLTTLFVVILITNIPLRGLWSLVIIISIILTAVLFSLFKLWDSILGQFADLHIYINMAGYLFIATILLLAWCFTVFVFDKRAYVVFTPGQIKVCEEIGGRERVFDTIGMTVEKQRDDWFRHIILGLGSGDLTIKTAGAERQQITMPNVAFIGMKIKAVEKLLREKEMVKMNG